MTYAEYRRKQQEEFDKLPIFFAFSNKQFAEALEKRGIDVEKASEYVYRFGSYGGFYLKKDKDIIRDYLSVDREKQLAEIMENDLSFTKEAFIYEMQNHEYPINWQGDYDVCSCFGSCDFAEEKDGIDYLEEMGFSPDIINVYREARRYVVETMEY